MKKGSFCLLMLAGLLMALTAAADLAQESTYDELKAKFAGTTFADWEAAGYEKDSFCVDSGSLGAMGFHASNRGLLDLEVNALEPEVVLLDVDNNVVGVEFIVSSREVERPELFGQSFHNIAVPGLTGYSLHAWFLDNPAGTFTDFNTSLSCTEGTLPPTAVEASTWGQVKSQ